MSSELRNRRLFKVHTLKAEPTSDGGVKIDVCLISGKPKIKYAGPDDVPTRTEKDGKQLWPYRCDFCDGWHATSHPPRKWREKRGPKAGYR